MLAEGSRIIQSALSDPEQSLNTAMYDGMVGRRPGRAIIMDSMTVLPSRVVYFDGTNRFDVTDAITNGDPGTTVINNAFSNGNAAIKIGCPFKFLGINFTLTGFAVGSTTLHVQSFSHQGLGSATLTDILGLDGTNAGGTMKQSGAATWTTPPAIVWNAGGSSGSPSPNFMEDGDLFWVLVFPTVAITGVNIAQITIDLRGQNPQNQAFRTSASGIVEFVTNSGDRQIVSCHDFPGVDHFNGTNPAEPRILVHDLSRQTSTPLRIPLAMRFGSIPGVNTSFQTFNGWLLGSTTNGYLWKYNGKDCSPLEAMPGMDNINNVVGAQGYLQQTPRGTSLETYHNRLMVTCDPSNPLGFYASLEDNAAALGLIPQAATVGGPNVWPLKYALGVPGEDGDRIVGASVVNDRYVIFTKTQVFAYDDTSIKKLNPDVGCAASGSIQRIDNNVLFLSEQGLYYCDGTSVSSISPPNWYKLNKLINWSTIHACRSVHDKNRGEYILWLPINGEWTTQLALVLNYKESYWRIASGWYYWDTDARRDANGFVMGISAACKAKSADGKWIVLTVDKDGLIWQENIGYDDNGFVFPSYVVCKPTSSVEFAKRRAWYVQAEMAGEWLEGYNLVDGIRFEQEVDARLSGASTVGQIDSKQATLPNAVATETQSVFSDAPVWPVSRAYPKTKAIKFSFGQVGNVLRAALHWLPSLLAPGGTAVPVCGKVEDLEVVLNQPTNPR